VILAALGLTRPTFPYGSGGQRLVMAFSFLLVVLAMATAVATSK
jgi:hypothetical protein